MSNEAPLGQKRQNVFQEVESISKQWCIQDKNLREPQRITGEAIGIILWKYVRRKFDKFSSY